MAHQIFTARRALATMFISAFVSSPASASPITISEAVHRAADVGPAVVQARGAVSAAEARARLAGLRLNPEVGLAVEGFGGTGEYRGVRQSETTLSVSQRFELGGKRTARRDVAEAELRGAQISLLQARTEARSGATTRFAELSVARDRLALAMASEARARELARIVRLLVEAGREPPLRALRAQAAAAEVEATRRAAETALLQASSALASVLGQGDTQVEAEGSYELGPQGTPSSHALNAPYPTETPSLPVQLALAERDAARARLRLEQAGAIPDVTGDFGIRRIESSRDLALVAGISVPIPLANNNRNAVQAARIEAELAEARLAQAQREDIRLVRDARSGLDAANARVASLELSGLREAREAVRLAEIGYRAGKFSLLELLDAQSALNQAETSLLDAKLARAQAAATLAKVIAR